MVRRGGLCAKEGSPHMALAAAACEAKVLYYHDALALRGNYCAWSADVVEDSDDERERRGVGDDDGDGDDASGGDAHAPFRPNFDVAPAQQFRRNVDEQRRREERRAARGGGDDDGDDSSESSSSSGDANAATSDVGDGAWGGEEPSDDDGDDCDDDIDDDEDSDSGGGDECSAADGSVATRPRRRGPRRAAARRDRLRGVNGRTLIHACGVRAPCKHCGALLWPAEARGRTKCCGSGTYVLTAHDNPPIAPAWLDILSRADFSSVSRYVNAATCFGSPGTVPTRGCGVTLTHRALHPSIPRRRLCNLAVRFSAV